MHKEENQGQAVSVQLRPWRESRKWSQYELHQRSGVARNEISNLERGKREPYPRTLARLGAALGCPPHLLWSAPDKDVDHPS
jgi:transcriptional regulator with XRE-family HTH domain